MIINQNQESLSTIKRAKYNSSYKVRGSHILVHDSHRNIVTDVLDVNIEDLVPSGLLTTALNRARPELLLSSLDRHVWVHLAEELSVSRQASLDDLESQIAARSSSCHPVVDCLLLSRIRRSKI